MNILEILHNLIGNLIEMSHHVTGKNCGLHYIGRPFNVKISVP